MESKTVFEICSPNFPTMPWATAVTAVVLAVRPKRPPVHTLLLLTRSLRKVGRCLCQPLSFYLPRLFFHNIHRLTGSALAGGG